jgi:hypothetical protein
MELSEMERNGKKNSTPLFGHFKTERNIIFIPLFGNGMERKIL